MKVLFTSVHDSDPTNSGSHAFVSFFGVLASSQSKLDLRTLRVGDTLPPPQNNIDVKEIRRDGIVFRFIGENRDCDPRIPWNRACPVHGKHAPIVPVLLDFDAHMIELFFQLALLGDFLALDFPEGFALVVARFQLRELFFELGQAFFRCRIRLAFEPFAFDLELHDAT